MPQISLYYNPVAEVDSVTVAERKDWQVSYDLGRSWKKIRKVAKVNSSLFKVDVVYCEKEHQQTVRDFIAQMNRTVPLYKRIGVVEFSETPLPRNGAGKLVRK